MSSVAERVVIASVGVSQVQVVLENSGAQEVQVVAGVSLERWAAGLMERLVPRLTDEAVANELVYSER